MSCNYGGTPSRRRCSGSRRQSGQGLLRRRSLERAVADLGEGGACSSLGRRQDGRARQRSLALALAQIGDGCPSAAAIANLGKGLLERVLPRSPILATVHLGEGSLASQHYPHLR
ncbi:hypothetical protein NL676_018536 [Syzygium grande]|nr:hypothetical protein NL676_018536 [Syzygium grande]